MVNLCVLDAIDVFTVLTLCAAVPGPGRGCVYPPDVCPLQAAATVARVPTHHRDIQALHER